MPRGRPPNLDKRIADLIAQLKQALVAREQQRVEATVARQVDALVRGLGASGDGVAVKRGPGRPRKDASIDVGTSASPKPGRGSRGKWTPARRTKLKKAQAAYWANMTPAQRKERIRKMQAGRGINARG
jgi:hypothetical protein